MRTTLGLSPRFWSRVSWRSRRRRRSPGGPLAHQYIMGRAIDLLPPELKPLFEEHRTELIVRVIDPDTWRLVGWEEDPNHFFDFGVKEYGPYPFTAVPRDYGAALEKFGPEVLERNGRLPWRLAEIHGRLRRAFEDFRGSSPYAVSNACSSLRSPSHYVQDAHQPLHAIDNYDGQLTRSARRARALRARPVRAVPVAAPHHAGRPEADRQRARRGLRHAARELPAGRGDPEGRQGRCRRARDLRRRVLRAVPGRRAAGAWSGVSPRPSAPPPG